MMPFSPEIADIFLKHSFDAVVLASTDGKVYYMNDPAAEILGSRERLVNRQLEEVFPELKDEVKTWAKIATLREISVRLNNDKKLDLRVTCCTKSNLIVIFMRNQSTLEDLENTKNLLNEAEDMAKLGSFELNLKTGEGKRSKGVKKLLGLNQEAQESGFKDYLDRLNPDERIKIQEVMQRFRAGMEYQEWEQWIVRKDGEERLLEARARLQKGEAGEPEKLVGINRDITESRMAESKTIEAVLKAQEEERSRIAREIHDGIGPTLSGIKLYLERLTDHLSDGLREDHQKNVELLNQIYENLRNLSHKLVPKSVADFGLIAGLEGLYDKLEQDVDINITFRTYGSVEGLSKETQLSLYRITQELTNNALKHARASHLEVQIIDHPRSIVLLVEDDGIGMSRDDHDLLGNGGIGLLNVDTRVKTMMGAMIIESAPGKGTSISIEIPKE